MNKPLKDEIRDILQGLKEGYVTVSESLTFIAEAVDEDNKAKLALRRRQRKLRELKEKP